MKKLRENVYIGGYRDVLDARELKAMGITAILNVAYEIDDPAMYPAEIRYLKVGLTDSNENHNYMKRLAVDLMEEMMNQGETVLVHCAAGLSRSVFVGVMAVARKEDKEWTEIFKELKNEHPFAMIGPLFHGENKLYHYYKEQEERDKKAEAKSE